MNPKVTVKLDNPIYNSTNLTYSVDVMFMTDTPGTEIQGINFRLFYDASIFKAGSSTKPHARLKDFKGDYKPTTPNPPILATSPTAGSALFGLRNAVTYLNGAVDLKLNRSTVIPLDYTWKTLFSLELDLIAPVISLSDFCPSIILDLEEDTSRGGYLPGSDGIVIIATGNVPPKYASIPTDENVIQFNWKSNGSIFPPYGFPIKTTPLI